MNAVEDRRAQAEQRQQQAVQAPAPLFIRACPGAGKTRVLVDRHCQTPPGPRRTGRAMLSFTNVAADELRDRCSGSRTDLTAFPHFIGTFDSFLWRYLVRPFLPAAPAWKHVLSWDQVPAAVVGYRKVPLSSFDFRYDPTTRATQVEWPDSARILANSTQSKADYLRFAKSRRDLLWQSRGYMTGHETRIAALDHVRDPSVTKLLRHRFFEVVVDEAQDCSELDLVILEQLRRAGLPLVIVADPDQGIYEWNDARPEELRDFTDRLSNRRELDGNWRSSSPVCQLAATLRPMSRGIQDDPVGDHHDVTTPLLLLPYGTHRTKASALLDVVASGEAFVAYAALEGIAAPDSLALAYRNNAIPTARSRPAPRFPKGNDATALAWAAAVFAAPETSTAARKHALSIASTLLHDYWYPDTEESLTESLITHDIQPAIMRRRAARLLAALPPVDLTPARDWRSTARSVLKAQLPPTGEQPQPPRILSLSPKYLDMAIGMLIGMPEEDGQDAPAATMRSSTIHQAKGGEADAVLIHLPKPKSVSELLQAWADPLISTETSELLRTYYVAITRARRLLALTYPLSQHSSMTAHLDTMKIEYRAETAFPAS
ncbi:UvrD-helicase domain-containing protein [Streptomyces sp. NPDC005096]|uniref:UvrD-helicase domain-containing protein n=1 Tax=Streptomyces sp. NPDC005096 TaxID=3154559 RepID=UPI0033BB1FD3